MTDVFKKEFSEDTNTFITKVEVDKPKEEKKKLLYLIVRLLKKGKIMI